MMFIWVLDSRPDVERYVDVIYSRLCGLRLFRRFSEVFYLGSLDEDLIQYLMKMFSDSRIHKLDKLDLSKLSEQSKKGDILIIMSREDLGGILGDYTRFLEVETPALLIISFEGGSPVLVGVLTVDLFRFIEV